MVHGKNNIMKSVILSNTGGSMTAEDINTMKQANET